MKMMGMLFIIYGHLFSYGYEYVYTFNVPVFFVISGFLFKEEQSAPVFWNKLWRQLVIPMLVICLLNNTYLIVSDLLHHRLEAYRFLFPLGILAGQHRFLNVCWFIYTLVLLKIICRYVRGDFLRILLAAAFLTAGYFIAPTALSHDWRNAVLCVLLTYPFFVVGHLVKESGFALKPLPWWACLIGAVLSGTVLYFVTRANGEVFVYRLIYGTNIFLYLLGGLAGTCLLFFVSKMFDRPAGWVRTLSVGSVIILGFHLYLIVMFRHFVDRNPLDVLVACVILLLFLPVIRFCLRFVPWLVGNRK